MRCSNCIALEVQVDWLERALVVAADCFEESMEIGVLGRAGDLEAAQKAMAASTKAMKARQLELGLRPEVTK